MKKSLENEVFNKYNRFENYCKICREVNKSENEEVFGPFSFFHIGKNIKDKIREIRLMFVGKTSWYNQENNNDYDQIGHFLMKASSENSAFSLISFPSDGAGTAPPHLQCHRSTSASRGPARRPGCRFP